MNIQQVLLQRFRQALTAIGAPADSPAPLTHSTKPEFGEYQFNGAMPLAKRLQKNPREIAAELVNKVDLVDIADKLEVAGPGFINIHLSADFLSHGVKSALADSRLGIEKQPTEKVVVDYSSPNLAKEMHVGHLRSTIIGDATVNTLELLGHQVIRQNHMGDWGTQFGMLLAHLSDKLAIDEVAETALADLEEFYREAKVRFDSESGFADRARDYVVRLQGGEASCLQLWQRFIDISVAHSQQIYQRLNVSLSREHVRGESAYNADLPVIIQQLQQQDLVKEDDGAQVVFLDEMKNRDGKAAVCILQKSGGGYLYATTDLAAIRYRVQTLKAQRILIFTDARQSLHFKQIELIARKAGFLPATVSYEHCPFGMMLGKDGRPFKTRTGETIKLTDLIDEAIQRSEELLAGRDSDLAEDESKLVAHKVAIGAIKYADLSKNRNTDYVFDWDTMLSFEGNTAPYLQYAYTRVKSIFRHAGQDMAVIAGGIELNLLPEKNLAVSLLQLQETLEQVSKEAAPHLLCTYLYELASVFMRFYEACPILKDEVTPAQKSSRLQLAALTARTIDTGLELLGIETMEKM